MLLCPHRWRTPCWASRRALAWGTTAQKQKRKGADITDRQSIGQEGSVCNTWLCAVKYAYKCARESLHQTSMIEERICCCCHRPPRSRDLANRKWAAVSTEASWEGGSVAHLGLHFHSPVFFVLFLLLFFFFPYVDSFAECFIVSCYRIEMGKFLACSYLHLNFFLMKISSPAPAIFVDKKNKRFFMSPDF